MSSRAWLRVRFVLPLFAACVSGDDAGIGPRLPLAEGYPLAMVASYEPRVWYNPYATVPWSTTQRYKAQTHDHTGLVTARLLSYDTAGYDFIPLMEYSGVASLDYSLRQRLWPSDSVLPSTVKSKASRVRAWIPDGEEVGYQHITSLFLTNYIAKWESGQYPARLPWMYGSTQEAIDLIGAKGGFAIVAHPWGAWSQFANLTRYKGVEIYNAYAEQRFESGADPYFAARNRNLDIAELWDRTLLRGDFIVGVAVNDHYGPYRPLTQVSRRVRDSGKILVLSNDPTLAGFETAMRRGSIFAVADFGDTKDRYLGIDSVKLVDGTIRVWTTGTIRWIVDGATRAGSSDRLVITSLLPSARFVRFEVRSPDGSTVYSQAFQIRPRGDTNGDFQIDSRDEQVCRRVTAGTDRDPLHIAACAARPRTGVN